MSESGIGAGRLWFSDLFAELASTGFGISCITPENHESPWLNFEAGALSKSMNDSSALCPMVFDMPLGQLKPPLSQFQAKAFDREGIIALLAAINQALGPSAASERHLEVMLDRAWPELQQRLGQVPAVDTALPPPRPAESILEEVLQHARAIRQRVERKTRGEVLDELGKTLDETEARFRTGRMSEASRDSILANISDLFAHLKKGGAIRPALLEQFERLKQLQENCSGGPSGEPPGAERESS
jgi:hypothetical protein